MSDGATPTSDPGSKFMPYGVSASLSAVAMPPFPVAIPFWLEFIMIVPVGLILSCVPAPPMHRARATALDGTTVGRYSV